MKTYDEKNLIVKIFVIINTILEKVNDSKNDFPEELRQKIAQKIKQYYVDSDLDIKALQNSLILFKSFLNYLESS